MRRTSVAYIKVNNCFNPMSAVLFDAQTPTAMNSVKFRQGCFDSGSYSSIWLGLGPGDDFDICTK